MGEEHADSEPESAEDDAVPPKRATWNLAGWIFRDGDCVAIERRGDDPDRRSHVLAD